MSNESIAMALANIAEAGLDYEEVAGCPVPACALCNSSAVAAAA